jgi:hypothetical protein
MSYSGNQVIIMIEGSEALAFLALVAIPGVVASDEIGQMLPAQWVGFQREVFVGAKVIDP